MERFLKVLDLNSTYRMHKYSLSLCPLAPRRKKNCFTLKSVSAASPINDMDRWDQWQFSVTLSHTPRHTHTCTHTHARTASCIWTGLTCLSVAITRPILQLLTFAYNAFLHFFFILSPKPYTHTHRTYQALIKIYVNVKWQRQFGFFS